MAQASAPIPGTPAHRPSSALVALLALSLLHAAALALLFDPLSGLIGDDPLVEQDYGLHDHHLRSARSAWESTGRLWGYNPSFMAGYTSGTIHDASIKLLLLVSLIFPSPVMAFKILVFLSAALVPAMAYWTGLNFFGRGWTALAAALLGTAYWWNSLPREMLFYGMVGFPLAAYFSFLLLSLLYRLVADRAEPIAPRGRWGLAAAWIAGCVLILAMHPQSVLIVAPSAAALLIARGRRLRPADGWVLGAGIALGIAANLFWLWPALDRSGDAAAANLVREAPVFVSLDPLTFLRDTFTRAGYWTFRTTWTEKGLRVAILALGLAGLFSMAREKRWASLAMLTTAAFGFFALAYFGSLVEPLRLLQPLRFKVPMNLALVFAAAFALTNTSMRLRRGIWGVALAGAACFTANLLMTEVKGDWRLRTGLPARLEPIVAWMRDEAPREGRVLFEESGDESGFIYDGVYLSSFAAHRSGRELIGGPANLYNDRRHFAEFHSGRLFKRAIGGFTSEELAEYFKLYNIGAIVAFHPESVDRLLGETGLIEFDRRVGPAVLMKVRQTLTWTLEGEAEVRAGPEGIRCTNVRGDALALKYHWVRGMRCEPPAEIEPILRLDDPTPFIRVLNPPREFIITID